MIKLGTTNLGFLNDTSSLKTSLLGELSAEDTASFSWKNHGFKIEARELWKGVTYALQ